MSSLDQMLQAVKRAHEPEPNAFAILPSDVWDTHREIARCAVKGLTPEEISDALSLPESSVRKVLANPIIIGYMEQLREKADLRAIDVAAELKRSAQPAIKYIAGIVENGEDDSGNPIPPELRAKLCTEVLDRAGYGKISRNIHIGLEGKLTQEDIAGIMEKIESSDSA